MAPQGPHGSRIPHRPGFHSGRGGGGEPVSGSLPTPGGGTGLRVQRAQSAGFRGEGGRSISGAGGAHLRSGVGAGRLVRQTPPLLPEQGGYLEMAGAVNARNPGGAGGRG